MLSCHFQWWENGDLSYDHEMQAALKNAFIKVAISLQDTVVPCVTKEGHDREH